MLSCVLEYLKLFALSLSRDFTDEIISGFTLQKKNYINYKRTILSSRKEETHALFHAKGNEVESRKASSFSFPCSIIIIKFK